MKALVTGSGGLIGSECVRTLSKAGWTVLGIDNDMRARFFGLESTTRPESALLIESFPNYRHSDLDIRDRASVRDFFVRNVRTSSSIPPRSPRTTKQRPFPMTISMSTLWAL